MTVWAPQPGSQYQFVTCPIRETLYEGTRGPGKALSNDAQCLTDSGWKRVGDISHADRLVAADGTYTALTGIFPQGERQLYRLEFDDGASVDADADHRWLVFSGTNGWRDRWVVRTTAELLASRETYWAIPTLRAPAPGKQWEGLDPYAIGLLLGDGTTGSAHTCLYSADQWCIDHMVHEHGWMPYRYGESCWRVVAPMATSELWKDTVGRAKAGDKRVDPALLMADPDSRLGCLQGLMDSDGSTTDGKGRFVSLSEQLARDVQYLVRSLGGKASCYRENRPSPKGGADWRWRVNISHCSKFNPFRLPRKASQFRTMNGRNRRIVSIKPVGVGPATCFAVEHPNQLFVCQDFIVTHNTNALLFDFAQHCGRGHGPHWRGILFRETYKQLEDLLSKCKEWFFPVFPGIRWYGSKDQFYWRWKSGEMLYLRHFAKPDDYWNYHGHEYPWIGWEELTNWPTIECYESMKSCQRSSHSDGMPRKYRATCNPYGIGHNWVKKFFIDPAPPGVVIREPGKLPRVRIHGSIYENKILLANDPDYIKTLEGITNEHKRRAWLEGDWNITAGGMFDDLWEEKTHVIKPFRIPPSWRIDRSFDWGSSAPFSVIWWAESDGTHVRTDDGRDIMWPRGTVVAIAEWYGWNGNDNEGSKLLAGEIARGIRERERFMQYNVHPGPADSAIYAAENGNCIADDMGNASVSWTPADKSPGSRKAGAEKLRRLLKASLYRPMEEPGIFVFNNCRHIIRTVPVLPRDEDDPDDTDKRAEDHAYDAIRYRIQSPTRPLKVVRLTGT